MLFSLVRWFLSCCGGLMYQEWRVIGMLIYWCGLICGLVIWFCCLRRRLVAAWLVGGLGNCLVGWFVVQLVGRLLLGRVVSLVGWFVVWLLGWLIAWCFVQYSVVSLVVQLVSLLLLDWSFLGWLLGWLLLRFWVAAWPNEPTTCQIAIDQPTN